MSECQINSRCSIKSPILNCLVHYRYSILLVVSFVLMTLMTFCTPLFLDDWHYGFIFEKEGQVMQRHIDSVSDLFESLHNYYLYKDGGRCIANGTAMIFLAFISHDVFAVCNGVMFALMLHLFCLNFAGKRENYFTVVSIVLLYFVMFLPAFKYAMLWLDGSCNYLWCTVLILSFHYLLSKDIHKRWWPLLFIYGIIVGDTNEGIMIGLSVGYMVYYLSHFKELTPQRWVMLISLAIGVAFLVFAPSVWNTALHSNVGKTSVFKDGIGFLFVHIPSYLAALRVTYVAILLMLYKRRFPLFWGTSMVTLFLLCMLISAPYDTTYFGVELCALAAVLQIVDMKRICPKCVTVITALPILTLLAAMPLCAKNYTRMHSAFSELQSAKGRDVIVRVEDDYPEIPYLTDRFMMTTLPVFSQSYMIAKYYGKESVYLIPNDLDKIGKNFDLNSPYPCYVCEWDGADEVEGKILYVPSPLATYPIFNRIGRYTLTEQDIEGSYAVSPRINGKRYLVIKKNPLMDDRVLSIEVRSKEQTLSLK